MKKLGTTLLIVVAMSIFFFLANTSISPKQIVDDSVSTIQDKVGEVVNPTAQSNDKAETSTAPKVKSGTALATLSTLKVKPSQTVPYDGSTFSWKTAANGCKTDKATLIAGMSKNAVIQGCQVISGTIVDAYTGNTMTYTKGANNHLDTEHIVARKNAMESGLSESKFDQFANDPLNLVMVNASYNRSKQDDSADKWLPSTSNAKKTGGYTIKGDPKSLDCKYVANQITVKAKYGLSVTAAEKSAMTKVLNYCPSEGLAKVDGNNLN